jgi:hypothetical protein
MELDLTIASCAFVALVNAIRFVLLSRKLRQAEGQIRSLLEAWMQENDLILLRYRQCWFRCLLDRVVVVDRQGVRWKGRAFLVGRLICKWAPSNHFVICPVRVS